MNNWISTKERLPEPGKYVIAKHDKGTWIDSTDQENVNTVIVKLVKGISLDERDKMSSGDLPDPIIDNHKRSEIFRAEDQNGNNLVPYNWQTFGISSFFGQEITEWIEIPSK